MLHCVLWSILQARDAGSSAATVQTKSEEESQTQKIWRLKLEAQHSAYFQMYGILYIKPSNLWNPVETSEIDKDILLYTLDPIYYNGNGDSNPRGSTEHLLYTPIP